MNEANRSVIVSGIKYKGEDLEEKFIQHFEKDDYKDRVMRIDIKNLKTCFLIGK